MLQISLENFKRKFGLLDTAQSENWVSEAEKLAPPKKVRGPRQPREVVEPRRKPNPGLRAFIQEARSKARSEDPATSSIKIVVEGECTLPQHSMNHFPHKLSLNDYYIYLVNPFFKLRIIADLGDPFFTFFINFLPLTLN
jgi:hypothetical protein